MPNGRAVAQTLQIGDVVGEVVITVTEAMKVARRRQSARPAHL
jgi:hypothetical protein